MSTSLEAPGGQGVDAAARFHEICPYLRRAEEPWRATVPQRDHRCGAVVPAALVSADKQRRRCLEATHVGCATYRAATAVRGDDPRRVTRWGLARTAPVVFDTRRFAGPFVVDGRGRPVVQAALVGVMAVAFGAVAIARLTDGSGAVLDASSTPPTNAVASPTASATSSVLPPTPRPSPSPDSPITAPTATLAPIPAPSATPARAGQAYAVQFGDTLYVIALRFGTSVQAIQAANEMGTSTVIRTGQVLLIPS